MATTVVVLGTGGTIAGTSTGGDDHAYRAATLTVQALIESVPATAPWPLECKQVAQVDSKDMRIDVWQALLASVESALARVDVAGVVITHGTDTLEETAYFLDRLISSTKPVVLTAAMRPATSVQADGPRNLADAVAVAANEEGLGGAVVVMNGRVHAARWIRKRDTCVIDAFDSGDAPPLALVEAGRVRQTHSLPHEARVPILRAAIEQDAKDWPWVEIVMSHAHARGDIVRSMVALGVDGIVVAGTGHGTIHENLEAALHEASAKGVRVWRASRCAQGRVESQVNEAWPAAGALSPAKARIELMLQLLSERAAASRSSR